MDKLFLMTDNLPDSSHMQSIAIVCAQVCSKNMILK